MKKNLKLTNKTVLKIHRRRTIKRYIKNTIYCIILLTFMFGLFDFAFKQWDSEINDISQYNKNWVETYTK